MAAGSEEASGRGPWARFDDLVAGTAFTFDRPFRVLAASDPSDVVSVLAEVERATTEGAWAFGYLAYEAAAGLDPRWAVHTRRSDEALPLVVFGLAGAPASVPPVRPPDGTERAYRLGPWERDWTEAGTRRTSPA